MNRGSRKPVEKSRHKRSLNMLTMKKFSYLLAVVLIFGAASAFTTAKPMMQTIAYGNDGTGWKEVNVEDVGVTYQCNNGSEYCLYQDESFDNPLPGQEEGKHFVDLE
jgi:hypothetical protein